MTRTRTVLLDDDGGEQESGAAKPGTTIGKYVVRSKIGSGGCGTVYAAYDPVLEREVAVKLLARGPSGEAATIDPGWPRLVREARMLARLSEPQVVTVYDVGDADGQAFLAMEMVDGGDLQDWIRRHRGPDAQEPRPLRAALELLEQAGRGLAVAHEAGIVHGDFKPANVLIDARGRAKVSDFGIARLAEAGADPKLDPARSDARHARTDGGGDAQPYTLTTSRGRPLVGTPAYMAPEQFEGRPADVASDLYAFCVTLYQATYGVLPHRGKTIAELAARKAAGKLQFPSSPRVPGWLTRLLHRGLHVERQDRHPDMAAVLRELARARGRAGRRWFALGGAGAGVGAVVAIVSLGDTNPRCRDAADQTFPWNDTTATEVRRAFAEAGDAANETVGERAVDRLDDFAERWRSAYAEACEAAWSDPRVAEQSFACLRRRRSMAGALAAAWREPTPRVLDRAPAVVEALPSVSVCVDPEALAGQPDLPENANLRDRVIDARERIDAALITARTGSAKEGLELVRAAHEESQRLAYGPLQTQAALALGQTLESNGELLEARELLRQAFFEAQRWDDHETAANAAGALVFLVGTRLEEHEQGLLWAEHARVSLAKTGGSDAVLLGNEAAILERLGRHDEAIARYERALEAFEPDEDYGIGVTHLRLGDALRGSNRSEDALEHYALGAKHWARVLGDDHPRLAVATLGRSTALSKLGRYGEAIEGYRLAIESLARAYGPDHPNIGAAQVNLGIALKYAKRYDEAEVAMREALRITEGRYGPDHLKVAHRRDALGRLLTVVGRHAEALSEHEQAQAIYSEGLRPDHPDRIVVHMNIGDAHRAAGDLPRAIVAYRRAVQAAGTRPDDDPRRGDTLAYLGRALAEVGRTGEARAVLHEAIARLEHVDGHEDALALAQDALASLD